MTRFIYIADSHFGADPMGYQQQTGYPQRLPDILAALWAHPAVKGGIDFVLHGGDMIDSTTNDHIHTAAKLFELPVPVYLCLGNHDLTTPDAAGRWLEQAPRLFRGGTPNYTVVAAECVIHVVPNHWGDKPYYWAESQEASLDSGQLEQLAQGLVTHPELPHIILTHSPVWGLPTAQTGLAEPYHPPRGSLAGAIMALVAENTNVTCVLGAHNHLNMRVNHAGAEFVTVSSLVETPFEFKLFEVTPQRMEMTTLSLSAALPFQGEYDPAKSFVQGRAVDRSFSRRHGSASNSGN